MLGVSVWLMDLDDLPREDEIASSQRESRGSFMMALFIVIAVLGVALGGIGLKMAADAGAQNADLTERLDALETQLVEIGAVSGDLDDSRLQMNKLEQRVQTVERMTQSIAQQAQVAVDKLASDMKSNRQAIANNNENITKVVEAVGGSIRRAGGAGITTAVTDSGSSTSARAAPPSTEVAGGAATGGVIEHEIVQGDILSKLAERYNVKLSAILEANPGIVPEKLKIGQVVKIPQ